MYKLLIIDDEYEIRNGLCNYFPWDQAGFEVTGQGENGRQAIDFINSHHVDAILCDIRMPIVSGIDLARELYNKKSKIKIVFISAYKDFEYAQKALIYGVKNYLVKPTKYNELMTVFMKLKEELDAEMLSEDNTQEAESGSNDKVISSIKSYVLKNYQKATLEDVSRMVHMNPYYISKFFREKTGENFHSYLLRIKMEKAVQFLDDINYKTYQVSEMVGYSNVKNFTRTFRKYYSMSPRDYRNKRIL